MTCSQRPEPLDPEEGEEATDSLGGSAPSGEGVAGLARRMQELHESMPPDALDDDRPADFAKNYKHYLYGHPKEEDA